MSLFRRTPKTEIPLREYESWEPATDAEAATPDPDAPTKAGRSRSGSEHLAAARGALDDAEQRDR